MDGIQVQSYKRMDVAKNLWTNIKKAQVVITSPVQFFALK